MRVLHGRCATEKGDELAPRHSIRLIDGQRDAGRISVIDSHTWSGTDKVAPR
jgi:hypothetical protein